MAVLHAAGSRTGEVLAGKYQIEDLLGMGGMGRVYRARNLGIERAVAIKLLNKEFASQDDFVERFLREARAASIVRHPNVVDVLDVGQEEDGTPFIVQELLVGRDLARHVSDHGGRLSPGEAVALLLPIAQAAGFAHSKGIVHRDLKPENIFLAKVGDAIVPKLLDFGISQIRTAGSIRMTETGVSMGTPAYMSPEQIRETKRVDARTDVWALGVILFEVIAGELPFSAESPSSLFVKIATSDPTPLELAAPATPLGLVRVVDKCLEHLRDNRYATGSELAVALRALLEQGELVAPSGALPVKRTAIAPTRQVAANVVSDDPGPTIALATLRPPRPARARVIESLRPVAQSAEVAKVAAAAALLGVACLVGGALTTMNPWPGGWPIAAAACDLLHVTPDGTLLVLLPLLTAVVPLGVGIVAMRRAWASRAMGAWLGAVVLAALAGGAFFVAVQLARTTGDIP
jgi:hypothetical protein